jgi:hypothetical protein
MPAGPDYLWVEEFIWYQPDATHVDGWIDVAYSVYRPTIQGSSLTFPDASVCASVREPVVLVDHTTGTVNSTLHYTVSRFPIHVTVNARWDGTVIGSVHTDLTAVGIGSFAIPAAPMGPHSVRWTYGTWSASSTFTVKPRIKIIPSSTSRGSLVNVSLRGYAAHETVRIRWKHGTGFTEIAHVTTSSTGSANIDVHVPTYVPNGSTSVRGDGAFGRAQTNAVTVSGGPLSGSTVKAIPSPVPTKTAKPRATPTSVPATATATATALAPTETPTSIPTELATATATSSAVVETSTPEPSLTATESATETVWPAITEAAESAD